MKANNFVNNNVKITLNLDTKKRLTALVQMLVTIDKRVKVTGNVVTANTTPTMKLPPRDSSGRFMKSTKKKGEKVEARLAKKRASFI